MTRTAPLIRLPFIRIAVLAAALPLLGGCDWLSSATSSETQMRSVEILPGTASDEMVTLDQASADGTSIDTSVPAAAAPATAAAADDEAAAPADGEQPGDTVITPPAGGAEPDGPAEDR